MNLGQSIVLQALERATGVWMCLFTPHLHQSLSIFIYFIYLSSVKMKILSEVILLKNLSKP